MAITQRRMIGAVLKAPLDVRWHAYAWTLAEADFAFFDLRADSDLSVEEIVKQPIAFRVAVHKSAWTTGRWRRVGKAELPPGLAAPCAKFIRDQLSGRYSIYLGGDIRPATREECSGLERCVVWDPEHVEDRLRDHFAGVPNVWVRQLALEDDA